MALLASVAKTARTNTFWPCAKRAAEFAAFLQDEVVADVGQAQWVFTIPKMLRPYFMHALVTRGGWSADGTWGPIPYVSASAAAEALTPGWPMLPGTPGRARNWPERFLGSVGWESKGDLSSESSRGLANPHRVPSAVRSR